jgi:hypothetical protein
VVSGQLLIAADRRYQLLTVGCSLLTDVELPSPAKLRLSLALLVFCVLADHTHHTTARNDLAFGANLLYRCPNLHCTSPVVRDQLSGISSFCKPMLLPQHEQTDH